jgi:hypothetical protein
MRVKFEKFEGTFVLGVSLSIYKKANKKVTRLIFDLGIFSLAFIFGKVK